MQKAIIGKKIGMTQIFDEKGIMIPAKILLISMHLCHFLSPGPPFYRNPLSFR